MTTLANSNFQSFIFLKVLQNRKAPARKEMHGCFGVCVVVRVQ